VMRSVFGTHQGKVTVWERFSLHRCSLPANRAGTLARTVRANPARNTVLPL